MPRSQVVQLLLPLLLLRALSGGAYAQTVLQITEKDGLLRVTVPLNDMPRVFLLDTGARTSLVTPKASGLSRTGLEKLLRIRLSGLGSSGTDIPVAPIKLSVGGKDLVVDVGITELPTLPGCDGIIGNDVLSQFKTVVIDYKAHKVKVWE